MVKAWKTLQPSNHCCLVRFLFLPACCFGSWLIPMTTMVEVAYASQHLYQSLCVISNAEQINILLFDSSATAGDFFALNRPHLFTP